MRIDIEKLKAAIKFLNHERNNEFPNYPKYSGPPCPERRREPEPELIQDFLARWNAESPFYFKCWNEHIAKCTVYECNTNVRRATLLYSLRAHLRGKVHAQVEYLNDCTGALVRHERTYEDQEKMLEKAGLFKEFALEESVAVAE